MLLMVLLKIKTTKVNGEAVINTLLPNSSPVCTDIRSS